MIENGVLMELMRNPETLTCLLNLILDPQQIEQDLIWTMQFPYLKTQQPLIDSRAYKLNCNITAQEPGFVCNLYNMRSYKALQFLTNKINSKSIMSLHPEIIGITCKKNKDIR